MSSRRTIQASSVKLCSVSVDSITQVNSSSTGKIVSEAMSSLSIIPGPASGEGCGMDGGCASCPYMKMNSLAALTETLEMIGDESGRRRILVWRCASQKVRRK